MNFYIVCGSDGVTLGCETSQARARKVGRMLSDCGCFTVERVDVPVTSQSIRLLLANVGGFATESEQVYPRLPTEAELAAAEARASEVLRL